MGLPLATTTIDVTRPANDGSVDLVDNNPPSTPSTVASSIPAVISSPTSRTSLVSGERVVVSASFRSDPCDVQTGDTLTDNTSGQSYLVLWALSRYELGLTYSYGDLQIVKGAAQ